MSVPTDSISDIAFLLIIFFILTTSIQRLTGFRTELPSGERAAVQQAEKTPTVAVHDGTVALDGESVSLDQLRLKLEALQLHDKTNEAKVVILESAGAVNYQQYFEVMAAISAAGGVVGVIQEEAGK